MVYTLHDTIWVVSATRDSILLSEIHRQGEVLSLIASVLAVACFAVAIAAALYIGIELRRYLREGQWRDAR